MTRTYLPFNFPGDKSYVSELLDQIAEFRDDLANQLTANTDPDQVAGIQEKLDAANEIVDTLVLWLNS